MTARRHLRPAVVAGVVVVVALALVPVVFSTYFTGAIATKALYVGLAAASLTFLAGFGGIVSLAQTGIYAVGGFVMARLVVESGLDPVLAGVLGVAAAVLVGLVFGAIASGSEGIYLLMITLAFGVITYYFFSQVTAFGGHEGINDVTPPGFVGDPISSPAGMYYLVLVICVLTYLVVRYVARTPFGLALQGVRDDPVRMRALGYDVRLHRTLGFAAGAVVAGLAGVLGTWHETRISPGTVNVGATIELLTIAVIGGLYRIEGAWLGALLYTLLDTYTRGITGRFETWIGIVFLVILVLSPDGLIGLAERARGWTRSARPGPPRAPAAPARATIEPRETT